MKAAVVLDACCMELQHVPTPTIRDDELLLKVRYCGICGSDLHLYKYCLFNPPAILGHECSAEIVEVGKNVAGWNAGDKVLAHAGAACGVCADCVAGASDLCLDAAHMGLGRRPGAYAEYLRAAPQMLIRLPDDANLKLAALAEPLSNAYRAAVRADITPGDRALVLGAGPLGLCVIVCLRRLGVETIIVSEPNPTRAAAAARVGATTVVNPHEQNLSEVIESLPGGAPNAVFEVVGTREVIEEAFALTPAGGRTVLLGICMESVQTVPVRWVVEEVSVIGSIGCDDEQFKECADWIVRGEVDVEPLISHVIGIEEVPVVFERLLHPTDELKVLIGF